MERKKETRSFQTLEEIELHKEQLKEVIELEDKEIKRLWDELTAEEKSLSRGEQISRYISYGLMVYDGVMTISKLKRNYGNLLNIFRR